MPPDQKICQVCGIDVGSQKRVKDSKGLYYCQACYAKLKKSAPQQPASPASPAPAAAKAVFASADCKKLVPQKQITNDEGEFVCQSCFAKRRAPVLAGQKPAKPIVEYQREKPGDESGAEPFSHSLPGGAIIAVAVLAGTFVALCILNFFVLGAAGPVEFLAIAIASGFETFFIFILACLLFISMFLAAKVMGGIEFGYLGAMLWKSIVAILGIFVASTLLSFLHLPCFCGLGATLFLYATVFVIVFKIEYTQAIVLALINIFVWFFATIALIRLMGHT